MKKYDYSHINLRALRQLELWHNRVGTKLEAIHEGTGGFDPPGHPNYFTQSVYSAEGNTLRHGPTRVIADPERFGDFYIVDYADDSELAISYGDLYIPVSENDPRFRLWEQVLYRHHSHCYYNPEREGPNAHFVIDKPQPRKEQYVSKRTGEFNADRYYEALEDWQQYRLKYAHLMVPDNHLSVHRIREHYPHYQPNMAYIQAPPITERGHWWTQYASPADYEFSQKLEDEMPEPVVDENNPYPTVGELMVQYNIKHASKQIEPEEAPENLRKYSFAFAITYRNPATRKSVTLYEGNNSGDWPDPAGLLKIYMQDGAESMNTGFEEWASGLGYNPDSRTDEKLYKRILKYGQGLKAVLGEHYEKFAEAE